MKLKIPLPSFERKHHQHSGILRNRYVIDTSDYSFFNIVHEALNPKMEWYSSYSWWTLGVNTEERSEVWKEEIPDKVFLFGLLKRYDAYYDGPIITWELGPVFINYRW